MELTLELGMSGKFKARYTGGEPDDDPPELKYSINNNGYLFKELLQNYKGI